MDPIKDYQDVLQNIETAVAQLSRVHPEMTNYTVSRVYEAAIAHYRAQADQLTPKPANLKGLEATLFGQIQETCEWRLGRKPDPEFGDLKPIPLEDLVACLRKLHKSVEFWTKEAGRQGYLRFIEQFV